MSPTAATDLKKELLRLVMAILDDNDYSFEFIDEAITILKAFNEFKLKRSYDSLKVVEDANVIPKEFRCPLSGDIMSDPVVLSSGKTYDRVSIEKLHIDSHSDTYIIPNCLVQGLISQWCGENDIELPSPSGHTDDNSDIDENKSLLFSLLEKLSFPCLSDQIEASQKLRLLTKKISKFQVIAGESPGSIARLILPLFESRPNTHCVLQENLIAALMNISVPDENKRSIAENPLVIPVLMDGLISKNMQTRCNAVTTLYSLSVVDTNKILIGKSGCFKPLINLIEEGDRGVIKDAANAIYSLCIAHENRGIAVEEGAVRVMFRKMLDRKLVGELARVIAMFSDYPQAVKEMLELNGVSHLLRLLREDRCARNKENYVVILYGICAHDRSKIHDVQEEENADQMLLELQRYGTFRARRKAEGLLQWLEKEALHAHTT